MNIPTKRVYFRNGKFGGRCVTINAADYNPDLHSTLPFDEVADIEFPPLFKGTAIDTKTEDLMDEAREVQSDLEELIAADEIGDDFDPDFDPSEADE